MLTWIFASVPRRFHTRGFNSDLMYEMVSREVKRSPKHSLEWNTVSPCDTCDIGEEMSVGRPSLVFSEVYDPDKKISSQSSTVRSAVTDGWNSLQQVVGEDPQPLFRAMARTRRGKGGGPRNGCTDKALVLNSDHRN